ncbi:MAG: phosphotransferase [Polyangiaceae bacterium]|nr:phosphotransferase [Polyangiaceae bacterium]
MSHNLSSSGQSVSDVESLANWQQGDLLAEGGSASLYNAKGRDGAQAVMKIARPGCEPYLLVEAQLLMLCGGVGSPALLATGEINGQAVLLMERIHGQNDAQVAAPQSSEDAKKRLRSLIEDIGSTLRFFHRLGWAHGDLKPENIITDRAGRRYLIDFGLASLVRSTSLEGGSWEYLPREILNGQTLTAQSRDVYAFAKLMSDYASKWRACAAFSESESTSKQEQTQAQEFLAYLAPLLELD